jgi:hypothetical protein
MLQEGRASMAQSGRKITAKDANQKLAQRRLSVLELAERLGNVAEACSPRSIGSDPNRSRHELGCGDEGIPAAEMRP